jgi:hypothetical protein
MVRRQKTRKDYAEDSNEINSEKDSDDNFTNNTSNATPENNSIPITKAMIVYYPGRPGIVNIRKCPSLESEAIGKAKYGDIVDTINTVIDSDNAIWMVVKYGDIILNKLIMSISSVFTMMSKDSLYYYVVRSSYEY